MLIENICFVCSSLIPRHAPNTTQWLHIEYHDDTLRHLWLNITMTDPQRMDIRERAQELE